MYELANLKERIMSTMKNCIRAQGRDPAEYLGRVEYDLDFILLILSEAFKMNSIKDAGLPKETGQYLVKRSGGVRGKPYFQVLFWTGEFWNTSFYEDVDDRIVAWMPVSLFE